MPSQGRAAFCPALATSAGRRPESELSIYTGLLVLTQQESCDLSPIVSSGLEAR